MPTWEAFLFVRRGDLDHVFPSDLKPKTRHSWYGRCDLLPITKMGRFRTGRVRRQLFAKPGKAVLPE